MEEERFCAREMLRSVANRGVFLGGVRIDGFGRYKSTVSGVTGLDAASAGQAAPGATADEARETVEEVPGEAKRGNKENKGFMHS